jgi:hypothetical protein
MENNLINLAVIPSVSKRLCCLPQLRKKDSPEVRGKRITKKGLADTQISVTFLDEKHGTFYLHRTFFGGSI